MIIGREKEIEELRQIYQRNGSEFVAIYGRRRVGKTFLVNEVFGDKITFYHTGLSPQENLSIGERKQNQLKHFHDSLLAHGLPDCNCPDNWLSAFRLLEKLLDTKKGSGRRLIFIDELPWMDTPRSGFITALEAFWNGWACRWSDIMLVVCGSASSWILDNLINNHGGLYNRLTSEIKLEPFTLKECEEFYKSLGIKLSRYDITQSYMIFGGIPYYIRQFKKGKSLAQNVDLLFFGKSASLLEEFDRLFSSLFSSPSRHKAIVALLGTRSAGYTKQEIAEKTGIGDGGNLSDSLKALIASGFIIKYVPFGLSKRDLHYKLIDPFCLFYIHFVKDKDFFSHDFWKANSNSQPVVTWRGLAFENVCFNHLSQIKNALNIGGVVTRQSAWSKRSSDSEGTQIDLLIERKDNVINMCEIKFYSGEFTVSKQYYLTLMKRFNILSEMVPKKMSIYNTLITTYGLAEGEYSGVFDNVITLDDLFG